MLVLSRKLNQSIMIGDDVVVTVLEVKGDQVRIGISAPRDVAVHREEVLLQLREANRNAVLSAGAVAPPAPAAATGRPAMTSHPTSARRRGAA